MKRGSLPFRGRLAHMVWMGKKTETRRLLPKKVPQKILDDPGARWGYSAFTPEGHISCRCSDGEEFFFKSRYGRKGDQLWIREPWRTAKSLDQYSGSEIIAKALKIGYERGWAPLEFEDGFRLNWTIDVAHSFGSDVGRYRHARFMPELFSRTLVEVRSVNVERLQQITDAGAWAEGVEPPRNSVTRYPGEAIQLFKELWEKIHGVESWNENPFVFVIKFRRINEVHIKLEK